MNEALKRRIEERLRELAAALDISIVSLEWGPSDFEISPGPGVQPAGPTQYPLAAIIRTKRKIMKFTEDELDDCDLPGSQGDIAWQKLEQRFKEFLEEFAPQKRRIGF